ncbi:RPA-related protein RADX [Alexandromys fortis]|uniref:RPA-related protein RADX n=1 Tax=Alexandromys fortis TaxID=100897 RepID=UPI00215326FD|nr:RPA-related protein RADX [Microtus fortis]
MSGESDQPEAGPSHAGLYWPHPERNQPGVSGGVIRRTSSQRYKSWIQKVIEQITGSPRQCVALSDVVPVTVLAVQRYLLEDEPRDMVPKLPFYCYDVTISDGVYQEKCYLDPSLNFLVYQNILKVGIEVRIFRVSCLYNEKRLGQGILCIDKVHCGETLDVLCVETPFRNRMQEEKPERPLRGGRSHYLALWNNEDPYGDIWKTNKHPEEFSFNNIKIISLSHLEMTWSNRTDFPALLVRILHKSKLRYYGKPNRSMIEPYQNYLEVADSSGMVSVIMWNSMCLEWYKSLKVGLILLLQDYTVKKSHPFRIQPDPVDPQMKLISTIEICLNFRDPPTKVVIIPERQLKSEWKLPKLCNRFVTRSELDTVPEKAICDVVGMLTFVGRVQRTKKKENTEDFWSYRWIHLTDGTSEQPFIVQLFSTSQPEVFENIYPMTCLVCTQLRVVRNKNQVPNLLHLTTTSESCIFIAGHRGQPYAYDSKVKKCMQWIKTKTDSAVKNTAFGGYYPYPPVPETFAKYSRLIRAELLLTAISEVKKVTEVLQYREQRRIAIQGIIAAIKYIPHNHSSESAPASEALRTDNQPSTSQEVRREGHHYGRGSKRPQDDRSEGSQHSRSSPTTSSASAKRRIIQSPSANPVPVPQPHSSAQAKRSRHYVPLHRQESSSAGSRGKSRRVASDRWESQLWRDKKCSLRDHLHYSRVYPESIPRKFISEHGKFLAQQFNTQPAKYVPSEGNPPKLSEFPSARSLGHFEVTILGLNHEIAIDVAFLPVYSPEDVRTSQIDTFLTCMNYSCVYPPEAPGHEKLPGSKAVAGDIVKEAAELDRVHVICVLDIFNLGNNKGEVFLHKIYTPE